jgi:hypothetical protein
MAVLVEELQTQPLTFSHYYSPTTVGITIAPLQTVFTHNCVNYRTLACHAVSRTVPYSWRF